MAVQPFPDGMTAPQDWLDLILPKFPGGVPDMIKHEVLTVVRDLCRVGAVWCEWTPPVVVDGSEIEYPIATNVATVEVATVLDGRYGAPPNVVHLRPATERAAGPGTLIEPGKRPIYYWQPRPGHVSFDPNPLPGGEVTEVYLYVSLAPLDLCSVPRWLKLEHADTITDGVLASLHEMPGVNQNLRLAATKRARYMQRRTAGRNRAENAFGPYNSRPVMPYFARGSQR